MINLSAYQNYEKLFQSMSQLPRINSFSNLPGAYMVGKYGNSINKAVTSQMSGFFTEFRTNATQLNKDAKALDRTEERLAVLSEFASGTVSGGNKYGTNTLKVDQLATRQVNQGQALKGTDKSALAEGTYSFNINKENKTYSVEVSVGAKDTNQSVLEKVSAGINKLNIGVNARINKDSLGNQQLTLESANTGAKNVFTVSGNGAEQLGLNKQVQNASDAKFTFNGKQYQTADNNVNIDNGKVQLTLKKVSAQEEKLQLTPDTTNLQKNIVNFAESYNKFQKTLASQPDNKALQAVSQQLTGTLNRFEKELSAFGITKDSEGQLKIDSSKLTEGLSNNPDKARELFTRSNGLSERIQNTAQQAMRAPASQWMAASQRASAYSDTVGQMMNSLAASSQTTGNMFDLFL